MPTLSDQQILDAVTAAGFPASTWNTAIAVALAESGGRTDATNHDADGSTDYGLFQINSVHADLFRTHNWQDPVDNARMALAVSSNGSNWSPWTTYTSQRYRAYLPRAGAVTHEGPTGKPGLHTGEQSPLSGWDGITTFIGLVMNTRTWIRVLYVLAGYLLILYAFSRFTDVDNTALKFGAQLAIAKR